MTRMPRRLRTCLGVAATAWVLAVPDGALAAPQPPPPGNRYLFIVDATFSMSRLKAPLQNTLGGLIQGGLEEWMQNGDTYGVWMLSDRLYTDYPMQIWQDSQAKTLAGQAAGLIAKQRFSRQGNLRPALRAMFDVIDSVRDVTVLILTDGEDSVTGTAFDSELNSAVKRVAPEMRRLKKPIVIALTARGGSVVKWGVSSPELTLPLPEAPPPREPVAVSIPAAPASPATPTNPAPAQSAQAVTSTNQSHQPPTMAATQPASAKTDSSSQPATAPPVLAPPAEEILAPSLWASGRPSSGLELQPVPDSVPPPVANATPPASSPPVVASSTAPRAEAPKPPPATSQPFGSPPARTPIILTRENVTPGSWMGVPQTPSTAAPAPALADSGPANAPGSITGTNPAAAETTNSTAASVVDPASPHPAAPESIPPHQPAPAPAEVVQTPVPAQTVPPEATPAAPVQAHHADRSAWLFGAGLVGLMTLGGIAIWIALRHRGKAAYPSLITQSLDRSHPPRAAAPQPATLPLPNRPVPKAEDLIPTVSIRN